MSFVTMRNAAITVKPNIVRLERMMLALLLTGELRVRAHHYLEPRALRDVAVEMPRQSFHCVVAKEVEPRVAFAGGTPDERDETDETNDGDQELDAMPAPIESQPERRCDFLAA